MKIPQIKGWVNNLLAIFVLAIAAGIVNARAHGELQEWTMLWEVVKDSALYGLVGVCAWIALKSPLAKSIISPEELQNLVSQSTQSPSAATSKDMAVAAEVAKQEVQLENSENIQVNIPKGQ